MQTDPTKLETKNEEHGNEEANSKKALNNFIP